MFRYVRQFSLYLLSGGAAATIDVGGYFVLLHLGVFYLTANVISGMMGFITSFLLNKYVVFGKRPNFVNHLGRYILVDLTNIAILTVLLYIAVEYAGIDKGTAKFLVYAPVILWNFFAYKFLVYV